MENSNQPPKAQEVQGQMPSVVNKSNNTKLLIFILTAITVTLVAIGAYALGAKQSQPIAQNSVQITPIPTLTPDPTANWKTYKDSLYGYTILYPLSWILNQDKDSEGDARIELVSSTATLLGVSRKAPQLYISITSPFSTSGVAIANTPGGPADPLEVTINGKQQSIPVTGVGGGKEFDFYTFIFPLPGKKISSPRYSEPVSLNVIASYKTIEEGQTISKILSTFKFSNENASQVINGVDLKAIKYTLPQGWTAEIAKDGLGEENLSIKPNGGGYFSIKVYNYTGAIGRREYYCQVRKVCIEGTSKFTEVNIGNISGYIASALDNSGGGSEYFGSKGNKFYIISSYSPPSPNEFEKNYKKVLDSFIF